MNFQETKLKGAYIIEPELVEDERGFFARSWCKNEFQEHNLNSRLVQCNISFNKLKGTLRGMHYQVAPFAEEKLVRCTLGAIYDVILDLRPTSPTFKQWLGLELTSENRRMLYIPEGLAHGFLTLTNGSEVFYQMTEFFQPEYSRGVRWNDPSFGIIWPDHKDIIISQRDASFNDF